LTEVKTNNPSSIKETPFEKKKNPLGERGKEGRCAF